MLELKIYDLDKKRAERLEELKKNNAGILALAQKGEERYADSQGWLDTEIYANDAALERIEKKAAEIRENADAFVLIGVGGSDNAARSVIKAIQPEGTPEIIYAGNTLNPYQMNKMLKSLEGKDFYIDCIAKNFETLEPGSSFRVLRRYMNEKYGKEEAARRTIATGSFGSSLEELCRVNGYDFFDFPLTVGGRYTAMTNVGLLPMAVAGIDVRALVRGAADMQERLHREGADQNIAYEYACLRNLYYEEGYRCEMLSSFEPRFAWFYKWWIQLFAESEGKDGKGIYPLSGEFSEDLHSVGQFIQDGSPIMFESFLHVCEKPVAAEESLVIQPDEDKDYFDYLDGKDFYEINEAAYGATIKAHSKKLPVQIFEIGAVDAYHFGQIFYFFQFACYLSCSIMGVNAFDQPGVEAYKNWMFEALGK